MMKNEKGRSMVEMLGVLAIIGVLSVGGIAGYTMAMNKYRANELLNTASQLVILGKSTNGGSGTDAETPAADLGITTLPAGATVMNVVNATQATPKVKITGPGFNGASTSNPCGQANASGSTLFTIECTASGA